MFDVYTYLGHNEIVIKSFKDNETEKIYNQIFSKRFPKSIQKVALRKIIMMDNAECLDDLRIPPANHLEKLSGDREGQYSIRIHNQYRICFVFKDSDLYDVEIIDYH